jgi:hypothetical protein
MLRKHYGDDSVMPGIQDDSTDVYTTDTTVLTDNVLLGHIALSREKERRRTKEEEQ